MATVNLTAAKLSERAVKAAATKAMNAKRKRDGLQPLRGAAADRELRKLGLWPPGTGATPTGTPVQVVPPQPGPPTGISSTGLGGIAAKLAQTAAKPEPDPVVPPVRLTVVQPDWEIDGKFLHLKEPNSLKRVTLPIAAKPGPYTPTEVIHEILGQPEMLFRTGLAFAEDMNVLISGPTGVAKTQIFRWLAKMLNWNLITCQIHGGTAPEDLVGEFLPVQNEKYAGGPKKTKASGQQASSVEQIIKLIYGPVSKAILASQDHETILVFEEVNRIGNMQAFAKIYSLLDDTKQIEIPQKEGADGLSEVLIPGKLHIGANMNPADVGYIGTQVLDVALGRRFQVQYEVGYPLEEIEAEALHRRVKGLKLEDARKMVAMATMVRRDEEITYPFSFPDMAAWATMLPYLGWDKAAESSVVAKAAEEDKAGIRNLILLRPNTSGVAQ